MFSYSVVNLFIIGSTLSVFVLIESVFASNKTIILRLYFQCLSNLLILFVFLYTIAKFPTIQEILTQKLGTFLCSQILLTKLTDKILIIFFN